MSRELRREQGILGKMSFDSGRVGRKIEEPSYAFHDEEERSSIRKLDAHVEGVATGSYFDLTGCPVDVDGPPVRVPGDGFDAGNRPVRQEARDRVPVVGRPERQPEAVGAVGVDGALARQAAEFRRGTAIELLKCEIEPADAAEP